jgi:predicted sugar kinase
VLAIPNVKKGAYGDEEVSIFQPPTHIPREKVNEVSHQILMNIINDILKNN